MILAPKRMKNKLIWLTFVTILSVSCTKSDVFFQFKTIAPQGWSKDSVYNFDVPITDTLATYNVYVNIRNRGDYPYQNLWLFLSKTSPDSTQFSDTIECYLADQRGKWLGSGIGSIMEMPVLYEQNVRFKTNGIYRYQIIHGMREDVLKGINDIGLRVEKASSL